ncbi:MAG: ATP-binding cassette domain-containing protein, partial [Atopostipes suicloacalis]|nr:ATP-binding cassette domain-containing protein [Atopostipes suicloacalis]
MKIKNLSFSYGENKILKDLNFEVKEKEMLGIVGESGAGKSTLLRLLGGLIPLDEGEIIGQENIGIIFQNFNLFP